jgi:hypothetical protein
MKHSIECENLGMYRYGPLMVSPTGLGLIEVRGKPEFGAGVHLPKK